VPFFGVGSFSTKRQEEEVGDGNFLFDDFVASCVGLNADTAHVTKANVKTVVDFRLLEVLIMGSLYFCICNSLFTMDLIMRLLCVVEVVSLFRL